MAQEKTDVKITRFCDPNDESYNEQWELDEIHYHLTNVPNKPEEKPPVFPKMNYMNMEECVEAENQQKKQQKQKPQQQQRAEGVVVNGDDDEKEEKKFVDEEEHKRVVYEQQNNAHYDGRAMVWIYYSRNLQNTLNQYIYTDTGYSLDMPTEHEKY